MGQPTFDISALLAKSIESPEAKTVFESLDSSAKVKLNRDANEIRWTSKKAGVEIRSEPKSKRIVGMFLFAGCDGFSRYAGPLPHGVQFDMKSPAVKACFADPATGSDSECDSWEEEDCCIMVSYDSAGKITNIYLTTDF
jgi:hypothetical protein